MQHASESPNGFATAVLHGYMPKRCWSDVWTALKDGAPRLILSEVIFKPIGLGVVADSVNFVITKDLDQYVRWTLDDLPNGTGILVLREQNYLSEEVQKKLLRLAILDVSSIWSKYVFDRSWSGIEKAVDIINVLTSVYESVKARVDHSIAISHITGVLAQGMCRIIEHFTLHTLELLLMLTRDECVVTEGTVAVRNFQEIVNAGGVQYMNLVKSGTICDSFNWRVIGMYNEAGSKPFVRDQKVALDVFELYSNRHSGSALVGGWRSGILSFWMYIAGIFQCWNGHKIASDNVVAFIAKDNEDPSPKALEDYFRGKTLQEIALAHEVLVDTPTGESPLFNLLVQRLVGEIGSIFKERADGDRSNNSLSRASYIYRNARLAIFNAFPQMDVTLLLECRTSCISDDFYSLANMFGLEIKLGSQMSRTEAWITFLNAANEQLSQRPVFFTSGLVPGSSIGESAVPDIGAEVRAFWGKEHVMQILKYDRGVGIHVKSWLLQISQLEVKVTNVIDSTSDEKYEKLVGTQWEYIEASISEDMSKNSKQEFLSMAELANSLKHTHGRFMSESRRMVWVSGTVHGGWFTGLVSENEGDQIAECSWMVQCVDGGDDHKVAVCDLLKRDVRGKSWVKFGHCIVCSTGGQVYCDFEGVIA